MSDYAPMSPKLLSGALIVLTDDLIIPLVRFIVFQYNPATLRRTLTAAEQASEDGERVGPTTRAQPGPPNESISLTLELDATDYFEDPAQHPVGSRFGVAGPVARMENVLYPAGASVASAAGIVTNALSLGGIGRWQVPVTLFVWGPHRIVPVRVKTLDLDEQQHTPLLYPAMVTATLSMEVLPPSAFRPKDDRSPSEELAVFAYEYTALTRDTMGMAGTADDALDSMDRLGGLTDAAAGWMPNG